MRRALVIVTGFALGCGPTFSFVRTSAPPHNLTPHRPEDVLTSVPSTDAYVGIGVIEYDQTFVPAPHEVSPWFLSKLREKGAKLGCDAIQVHETTVPTVSATCLVRK